MLSQNPNVADIGEIFARIAETRAATRAELLSHLNWPPASSYDSDEEDEEKEDNTASDPSATESDSEAGDYDLFESDAEGRLVSVGTLSVPSRPESVPSDPYATESDSETDAASTH